MKSEFKDLDHCKPRDLVRLKIGDRTEWALVGSPGNEYLPVLVLQNDGVPRAYNAMGGMSILKPPFDCDVLCYGQEYQPLADQAGQCDIEGDVSGAADGSLIQSSSGLSLQGDFPERGSKGYYDLATGRMRPAPGGVLAIFRAWSLQLTEAGKPSVVIIHHQTTPVAKKAAA